jgi:sulfite reductase (ferredoxin)
VASGRIVDVAQGAKLRTALRRIMQRVAPDPILTPQQDIILSNVAPADRPVIDDILETHRVVSTESLKPVQRWALACPALPTCGLALTEAERVREPLIDGIAQELQRYGLENERLSVRITGCPNGCARPYAGDIGIVGRMPGFYALFVGGDFEGTRLNSLLVDRVPYAQVAQKLGQLFAVFAAERSTGEGFGDFCHRVGAERLKAALGIALKEAS